METQPPFDVPEDEEVVYTLRRLGPPQISELFPLQTMEQSPAAVGAPPLEKILPQSSRYVVSVQVLDIDAIDSTYNTRRSIPHQLGYNLQRSRQRYSFQRYC